MRLTNIIATAHPRGNRIDLAWEYPPKEGLPGVRVVRKESSHPENPNDGVEIATVEEGSGVRFAHDRDLKGETVYYYTLFPVRGTPPKLEPDIHNRVAAMATSPYDFGGQLYRLLPEIYRRYDAIRTPPSDIKMADEDRDHGVLRRFLDLPGYQLDQLYSLARAALNLCDLDRVNGQLLPLLAHWIGWQTNYALSVAAQRNEIRNAPRLYQTIGSIPTLEATVARVTGWPSRTKEFVYNVARTNQPERLNLWSLSRDGSGTWGTAAPASVNFAFEGRPACAPLADGSRILVYHTYRRHGWDIWAKRLVDGAWEPSTPVVGRTGIDKHPTVAMQGDRLWLFWETYDPQQAAADRMWRIALRTRTDGDWSPVELLGDSGTERRLPTAAVDTTGGLWLFWLERTGAQWNMKYNRHDGTAWQLEAAATLAPKRDEAPSVDEDLFVFVHPSSADKPLWLFSARREPIPPAGQTYWAVTYRSKESLDPHASDWSASQALPKPGNGGFHDREPTLVIATGGGIELFWSSTRNGGWSIFSSTLDIGALSWSAAQQITTTAYSERAPLALDNGAGGTLLVYRSNEALAYTSKVYGSTRTLDMRQAGTTTVDTKAVGKLSLYGTFDDFQTYTYDAGQRGVRKNKDRIARDTVGLYLEPTTSDSDQINAIVAQLSNVLPEFMPIAARAVFITDQAQD